MGERASPFKFWSSVRKKWKRYTEEEDNILLEEVERAPENVNFALLRAAERVYGVSGLTSPSYAEYKNNPYFRACHGRWYGYTSKKKVCMALFSTSHLARNRKIQARGKSLAIPIIQTPRFLCTTTTRDFGEMKWN